jgi:hypothetical protein
MTTLIFEDRGSTIACNAWTAAAKGASRVRICYCFVAEGAGFTSGATGVTSVELALALDQFLALILAQGPIVDLRGRSGKAPPTYEPADQLEAAV